MVTFHAASPNVLAAAQGCSNAPWMSNEGIVTLLGGSGRQGSAGRCEGPNPGSEEPRPQSAVPMPRLHTEEASGALYQGKVFRATLDARVIALDQKSGKEIWNTRFGDPKFGTSGTGAPLDLARYAARSRGIVPRVKQLAHQFGAVERFVGAIPSTNLRLLPSRSRHQPQADRSEQHHREAVPSLPGSSPLPRSVGLGRLSVDNRSPVAAVSLRPKP
jgi:hypothetical protein